MTVLRGGRLKNEVVKGDLANCGDDILGEPTSTFEHIASATSLSILNMVNLYPPDQL